MFSQNTKKKKILKKKKNQIIMDDNSETLQSLPSFVRFSAGVENNDDDNVLNEYDEQSDASDASGNDPADNYFSSEFNRNTSAGSITISSRSSHSSRPQNRLSLDLLKPEERERALVTHVDRKEKLKRERMSQLKRKVIDENEYHNKVDLIDRPVDTDGDSLELTLNETYGSFIL